MRYSCKILMKHEFYRRICQKYSNIKFHENQFSGSGVVTSGRTDKHDKVNSRFCNFAKVTKTLLSKT